MTETTIYTIDEFEYIVEDKVENAWFMVKHGRRHLMTPMAKEKYKVIMMLKYRNLPYTEENCKMMVELLSKEPNDD